ncbi:MAG: DUF4837 family protein [Flavobacteriaceae bacterium]
MNKILVLAIGLVTLLGCQSKNNNIALSASSGNINNLSVVVDNDLWEGSVGESIRNIVGAPLYGLPQDEPLFTMRQMPTVVFSDFARRNRTVLKIEKGKDADTKYFEDVYARPQKMVVVSGQTNKEIIKEIETNANKIISIFKSEEINEKQRRISKSLHKGSNIESVLGVTLDFPSAYRVATEDNNFFWLRRDIKTGTLNILVYEVPLNVISDGDEAINDVIKMRDSIGKMYVPGPLEGTFMITEEAYTPFLSNTIIDNKPTYETRSTWEVKDAYMAGPFLNYAIKDEINQRYIIFEGFAFAPSVEKRDYMFEFEAIAKSLKIK